MENQPYTKYKVLIPIKMMSGDIAPWFGQPGGGKQFLSDFSVEELLDMGIIKIQK